MVTTVCENCGGEFQWNWEEAFDKFGFNDGDGQVETWQLVDHLTELGYDIECNQWGLHNTIIFSIKKYGVELIPENASLGYDCPRNFLPKDIIALLDKAFPS